MQENWITPHTGTLTFLGLLYTPQAHVHMNNVLDICYDLFHTSSLCTHLVSWSQISKQESKSWRKKRLLTPLREDSGMSSRYVLLSHYSTFTHDNIRYIYYLVCTKDIIIILLARSTTLPHFGFVWVGGNGIRSNYRFCELRQLPSLNPHYTHTISNVRKFGSFIL